MEMSVREARAQFAAVLEAAQGGARITITKNGKPVAELGPPAAQADAEEGFWERIERVRHKMGLDKIPPDPRSDAEWFADFNDPTWTREVFGPEYFDDEPSKQ